MTRLSVNINKVATLRNARGENIPDVVKFALHCEQVGGEGITVHPRPDERHITTQDVYDLKKAVTTEFNIEGYPDERLIKIVLDVAPAQVTLVPDAPSAITSSAGWDVIANADFLEPIVRRFNEAGIRTSIFVDPDPVQVRRAAEIGAARVELYTKPYADQYEADPKKAIAPYIAAAEEALKSGIGLNAGHDLNRSNLPYFKQQMPLLDEVSIGHAIISDALYLGIDETIRQYLQAVK